MATRESGNRVFATDLGGTNLRVAIVDEDGRIHYRVKYQTRSIYHTASTRAEDIVQALGTTARECRQTSGCSFRVVSIAVPGTVNVADGRVIRAPNLPCLDGFQLASALRAELNLPAILENDANAAAVGEMWRGAARGRRTIACLTLGTGVGGGIILDGKLWRGVNDSAAEIGHMSVDPFAGVHCSCGGQGCLEVYASATAIVRMTREALCRFPESILQNVAEISSEDVYRAGKLGDELAREVFSRMGVCLGIGLANLINLLNPEMIVIAGGVANGWDLFARDMHEQIAKRAFPVPAAQVKIVRAECGDDAGMLGAARLGLDAVAA